MNFILQRYSMSIANNGSSQGIWMEDTLENPFLCHTIEDEKRDVKVMGETRIPAGFYPLKIWNDGKDPNEWVMKHREKYGDWFKFPIEIANVTGFSGVLVHVGYREKDTDACVLMTDTIGNNSVNRLIAQDALGGYSLDAVKRFYEKVYPFLESGRKSFVTVRDEEFLLKAFIPTNP